MEIDDFDVQKARFNTAQGNRPTADFKYLTKTVKGVSKLKLPRGSADLFNPTGTSNVRTNVSDKIAIYFDKNSN